MTEHTSIQIVEVGPRDGLQNEATIISTADKLAWISQLADAGLRHIEAAAFVHPNKVPAMADADELCRSLNFFRPVTYSALVPNEKGLDRAIAAGVTRVAVFTAASETFTQHNIGMSIATSLKLFESVASKAIAAGLTVRGYVSTCVVCPYEGRISPSQVKPVAEALLGLGCDQVSLGDTIGAAVPRDIDALLAELLHTISVDGLSLHCHDTFGTALTNVWAGLQAGVTSFDSSAGGLGGCPYAPGASGNLATEDLVYFLQQMGYDTGVDLNKLTIASRWLSQKLGKLFPSRVLQALGNN